MDPVKATLLISGWLLVRVKLNYMYVGPLSTTDLCGSSEGHLVDFWVVIGQSKAKLQVHRTNHYYLPLTSVDPVKATLLTSGWLVRAAPAVGP